MVLLCCLIRQEEKTDDRKSKHTVQMHSLATLWKYFIYESKVRMNMLSMICFLVYNTHRCILIVLPSRISKYVSHFYRFVCWKSIIKMTLLYNSHVQICFDASLSAMIEDDTKSIKLITLLNSVHIFTSSLLFVTHVLVFFSFISSHLTMTTRRYLSIKNTRISLIFKSCHPKIWTLS